MKPSVVCTVVGLATLLTPLAYADTGPIVESVKKKDWHYCGEAPTANEINWIKADIRVGLNARIISVDHPIRVHVRNSLEHPVSAYYWAVHVTFEYWSGAGTLAYPTHRWYPDENLVLFQHDVWYDKLPCFRRPNADEQVYSNALVRLDNCQLYLTRTY